MNAMRKILLFLTCLAGFAGSLQAQGRHELNVFLGGFKSEYLKGEKQSDLWGILLFNNLDKVDYNGDLYDLYEPHYNIKSGPVLTVNYHYILKDWLRVGAQANVGAVKGKIWYRLGNKPDRDYNQTMLSILPEVKLCIPGLRHFRLYGKVAAGVQFNLGTRISKSPVEFAWDVVPLGAEWGGARIYGNAEVCLGSVIQGGRIGMGFRF